jgi:PTH1 family peptidyl-tRNA hydrolase
VDSEGSVDKIVVGLGNPGSRYEGTRHNVGWMVLDRLAERAGRSGRVRARDGAATVRGRIGDVELLLVKPTTYMNLSGVAVRSVLARERLPMRDLLVVVDDMALPLGRLRFRARGSAGGHNGLRSIISEMGTESFARLRVGIGGPPRDAVAHVLGDFTAGERGRIETVLEAAADAVLDWARLGPERAADRWNGWQAVESSTLPDAGHPEGVGERSTDGAGLPPSSPDPGPAVPGESAVVRTRTGWRRLLPSARRPGQPSDGA